MKPFLYTQPCVSDHVRKTNRLFEPVDPRPSDIRVYGSGSSRPITRRTCIRHRTYSTEVTSFLSNLPLHRIIRPCSRTRAHLIYQFIARMSRKNSVFLQKFWHIFCAGIRNKFWGKSGGAKGRKTQDLRDGTEAVPYTLFVVRSFFSPLLVSILWRPLSPVCALGTVSLRLGHGAALTCHRHVIHYRAAASLP